MGFARRVLKKCSLFRVKSDRVVLTHKFHTWNKVNIHKSAHVNTLLSGCA